MPAKHMEWGVKPYGDGSGFTYEIKVTSNEGQTEISLTSAGSAGVIIEAADWEAVRDQIDRLLGFILQDEREGAQS